MLLSILIISCNVAFVFVRGSYFYSVRGGRISCGRENVAVYSSSSIDSDKTRYDKLAAVFTSTTTTTTTATTGGTTTKTTTSAGRIRQAFIID